MITKPTYCNPIAIENIASGRFLDVFPENQKDYKYYRSISDPSVIYHNGKWILYPSYSLAYVTEDFVHWKHVDIGVPHTGYSPAIVQFREKWYLCGHNMPEVYCADDPLGPFTLCGKLTDMDGNLMRVADGCYLADGDHLYFYWFDIRPAEANEDAECFTGTVGAELDPDQPWKLISRPVRINEFDPDTVWHHHGEHNQNSRLGYIEGQWMTKIGSRYYLLYSGSGTQYSSYANGICVSDEGPLSGFVPQSHHDPLTEKRSGLLRGAGHGSIVNGPGNTLWIFYTYVFSLNHPYERRIGMDPLGIDENGELYCPQTTEVPQFAPGVLAHPESGNDAGLLPLTFMQWPTASSAVSGHEALYAVDDSIRTYWQPERKDPEKCITIPLGRNTGYNIESLRIIWRDIGMETLDGILPGPFRYIVEYASSPNGNWDLLIDASDNQTDLCIDYRQFPVVKAYSVRLRICGAPEGIEPGLVSFTVFGKSASELL